MTVPFIYNIFNPCQDELVFSNRSEKVADPENDTWGGGGIVLSRRAFHSSLFAGLGAGCVGLGVFTDILDRESKKSLLERYPDELTKNRRSAMSTLIESVVTFGTSYLTQCILDKFKVMPGRGAHAAMSEAFENEVRESPILSHIKCNIMIPIVEEAIFRALPSCWFQSPEDDQKLHWKVGLTSNVLFAAIHNIGRTDDNKFYVAFDSFAAEQFILGTFAWHAQRMGGFVHSASVHMIYNHLWTAYADWQDSFKDEGQ